MPKNKKFDNYVAYYRRFLKNILRKRVKWNNLPDTIDERALNDFVLFDGYAVGFEYKGDIVVSTGALSGLDLYMRPTTYTSANPYIIPTQVKTVGKDCAICYNTPNYQFTENFNYLVNMYACRLADVDISVDTSIRNSRVCNIMLVDNDKDALRTAKVLEDVYEGAPSVFSYRTAFNKEGASIYPIKARDNIVTSELADARRNILADFYSAIGVDTIAVDKKERTNLAEMGSNNGQIKLNKDVILTPREKWCDEMNALFGLNISVEMNDPEEPTYDVTVSEGGDE